MLNTELSRCRECGDELSLNRYEPKAKRADRLRLIVALVVVVVPIAIIAGLFLFFKVVVKTYELSSGSMEPTLRVHDMLLVNRFASWSSEPKDGDIVVFYPPVPASAPFVKRVIAAPGERLRIHKGRLYRNAAAVNESYVAQSTAYELEIKNYEIYVDGVPLPLSQANIPPRAIWTSPDTVPRGCYFLMGDNRNDSEDSQIWGFAQRDGFFYSGPQAGRAAGPFEKATYVITPSHGAHSL